MATSANPPSKKRKVQFVEDREMSDTAALKHSRGKYGRTKVGGGDDRDDADTSTREEPRPGNDDGDYKSKHTLDSDEEEEEKYDRLDMDKVCFSLSHLPLLNILLIELFCVDYGSFISPHFFSNH